jgi:hypothetical protein
MGALGTLLLLACGLMPGCATSRGMARTAGAGTVKVSRAVGRGSVWAGKKVVAGTRQVAKASAGAVRSMRGQPASNGLDLGPPTAAPGDETLVASRPASDAPAAAAESGAHTVAQVGDGKGRSRTRDQSAHPDDEPESDLDDEGERPGDVLLASNDNDTPTRMIDDGDGIQHDLPTLDLDQMLAHGEARQASQAARAASRSSTRSTASR